MTSPYQRVLKAMQEKAESEEEAAEREKWFLYIVECRDGAFYTGITKDVERRIKVHNAGRGGSFTRARRPVKKIYQETMLSRTEALVREYAIKILSRREKESLILGGGASKPKEKRVVSKKTVDAAVVAKDST